MHDDLLPDSVHRPATDFGAPGAVTHFKGPYSGGPPASALEIVTPPLDRFGVAEIRRMVVIYVVLLVRVLRSVAGRLLRPGKATWARAAAEGAVDGF